jgi:hypothetical protein
MKIEGKSMYYDPHKPASREGLELLLQDIIDDKFGTPPASSKLM